VERSSAISYAGG
jgi:hypothetical protein